MREGAETLICKTVEGIPAGYTGFDIGPDTIELFSNAMGKAETILWNGPMGVFEISLFAQSTKGIADAFVKSQGRTIACGGNISSIKQRVWQRTYHSFVYWRRSCSRIYRIWLITWD